MITPQMIREYIATLPDNGLYQYLKESLNLSATIMDVLQPTAQKQYLTLADVFLKYEGTQEYNGIVKTIQTWFYGHEVKDAWCCTALEWGLAQLGLFQYTLNRKKEDNVYDLYLLLENAVENEKIDKVYSPQKGDIVVLCWNKEFNRESHKHITAVLSESAWGIECIGGNQNNGFNREVYSPDAVISYYRPHYDKETITDIRRLPNA